MCCAMNSLHVAALWSESFLLPSSAGQAQHLTKPLKKLFWKVRAHLCICAKAFLHHLVAVDLLMLQGSFELSRPCKLSLSS